MSETTKKRLTGPNPVRLMQTPTMRPGYVRIPEPEITGPCPKCGAENIGRKVYLWRVSDGDGARTECDVCSHTWTDR